LHYQFNSINYEQPTTISPEGKTHPQQSIQNQQLMAIETMTTGEACRAIHEDIDRLLKSIPPMVLELDTPLGGADVGCLIANIHECAERILELNPAR
jgi:hypothetical protein